jgi:hypothetical protein
MPKRKDAAGARASEILAEQAERRRRRALKAAQTRRERRAQREAEAQPGHEVAGQGRSGAARHTHSRVRPDALTVAIRGPMAARMRELAERSDMSLAKLLKDALLVYEGEVAGGYEPGRCLDILQAPSLAPEAPEGPPA